MTGRPLRLAVLATLLFLPALPASAPAQTIISTVAGGGPDHMPATAADLLWYDLFTPLGLAADEARAATPKPARTTFRTAGTVRFGWPRGDVLARASHTVSLVLFDGWVRTNLARAGGRAAQRVPDGAGRPRAAAPPSPCWLLRSRGDGRWLSFRHRDRQIQPVACAARDRR